MLATQVQRDVRHRVLTGYLPAWCAAQTKEADASAFDPDWSFLTSGLARWFLYALDDGTVHVRDGDPVLPDSRHAALFQKPKGKVGLYREGFFTVAGAGMLSREFGWPPENLTFESPRVEGGLGP